MQTIASRKMGFLEKISLILHNETEGSTSISSLLKVKGQLGFPEFKTAWEILFKRHPLLRAVTRIDGPDYFFDFKADFADIPLKEIHSQDFAVIEEEYSENSVKFFQTEQYLWRATLIQESETYFYVIFAGAHTICDARSISWLLGDLLRIVIQLRQGHEPASDSYPIPAAFDDHIDHNRFAPTGIQPDVEECFFQQPTTPAGSRSQNILHVLNSSQSDQLITACRQHGVTVTSVLAAALAHTIFATQLSSATHVNLWTAFDLRPYAKERILPTVLAFYAHMLPFRIESRPHISLWDLAKQSLLNYQQAIKEYAFGSATNEDMFAEIKAGIQTNIKNAQFFVPYTLSNAGIVDTAFTELAAAFTPEDFYFTVMNHALFGFIVFATTLNNHLCLNFNFSTPAFSKERAKKIADLIIESISGL